MWSPIFFIGSLLLFTSCAFGGEEVQHRNPRTFGSFFGSSKKTTQPKVVQEDNRPYVYEVQYIPPAVPIENKASSVDQQG